MREASLPVAGRLLVFWRQASDEARGLVPAADVKLAVLADAVDRIRIVVDNWAAEVDHDVAKAQSEATAIAMAMMMTMMAVMAVMVILGSGGNGAGGDCEQGCEPEGVDLGH